MNGLTVRKSKSVFNNTVTVFNGSKMTSNEGSNVSDTKSDTVWELRLRNEIKEFLSRNKNEINASSFNTLGDA